MLPKVSIITTTKNEEKHIPDFLKCIRGVFYPNLEVIIIDAVSTDRTLQLIEEHKGNLDIKILCEPDEGIYFGMNKGIDIATGDFILHLGADDRMTNAFVFTSIFKDQSLADCDIIYGTYQYVHNPYRTIGREKTFEDLLTNCICHQSILFKRSLFDKIGKYNTRFPAMADQALLIKCFRSGLVNIRFVDVIFCSYQLGGFSSIVADTEFDYYRKRMILKYFGTKTWLKFLLAQRLHKITSFLKI